MKLTIRIVLVLASLCMVIGNWKHGFFPLSASFLFLSANVASLVYNELKGLRIIMNIGKSGTGTSTRV